MASSTESDKQNLLLCTICSEEFEDSGDHIPRLLPCTHTLCETCIKQLIRKNKLKCPECRVKHDAKKEEKSFPQNKYLLMQIKRKPINVRVRKAQRSNKEICVEHKRELVLFCKEPECLKPACLLCLKNDHRRHDVVGIVDEKGEVLMMMISFIEKNLKEKVAVLNSVKDDVNRKTKGFLKDLERRRNEIEQQFDKIKKEAESQEMEVNSSIDNETAAVNESLNLLSSIRKNAENMDENEDKQYSETMNRLDILERVRRTVNWHLSGERTYSYPKFLSEKIRPFDFGDVKFNIKLPDIVQNTVLLMTPMRNITQASQLKCTGKQT